MLERVPDNRLGWRPHEKSRTLGQLALHIAIVPGGVQSSSPRRRRYRRPIRRGPQSGDSAELISTLGPEHCQAKQTLGGMDDATFMATWRMTKGDREIIAAPRAAMLRSIMLNHWYHHRGQLDGVPATARRAAPVDFWARPRTRTPSGRQMDAPSSRVDYDAELRLHNEILRRAYGIRPHDHVLDIGCGAGQTTRDAARLAVAGSVVGVDVSAPMIERARRLTEAAGLHNVTFEQADAEIHHFPAERFDVAISRFGTMFFADPVAAFTNIGRAMRPKGRLVMMVWQDHHRNEWSVSIQRALAGADVPAAAPGAPNPFSLADPATTERILETAGFGEAAFTDVHEPIYYGPDVAAALEWVGGFSCVSEVLHRLDPPRRRAPSSGCSRRSPRTRVETECGSTPVPGSSPRAVADDNSATGDKSRVILRIRAYAIREKGGTAEPFQYQRTLGGHDGPGEDHAL